MTTGPIGSPRREESRIVIAASLGPGDSVMGCERHRSRWRVARDAGHLIAEVALGGSRKLVFSVRHGESTPDTVLRHSLLGTSRKK